jgi:hypothetical protein
MMHAPDFRLERSSFLRAQVRISTCQLTEFRAYLHGGDDRNLSAA